MEFVNVYDQVANIAQIVRKCPNITLARAYVRAYRDFCNQTQWLKVSIPGATVAGTVQYNLGTDTFTEITGVRAVQLTDASGNKWGLSPADSGGWNPNRPSSMPRQFSYVGQGQVALFPTPDAVYSLLVSAIVQPKSEAVTQIPSECLRKYSNEIEAGALAYLLTIPGQPWSNPAMAEGYGRAFRSGIANAKADVQRGHNVGSQRVRPRTIFT